MPTSADDLFEALTSRFGPISKDERRLLEILQKTSTYADMPVGHERESYVEEIEAELNDLREQGFWSGLLRGESPRDTAGRADERWSLMAELGLLDDSPVTAHPEWQGNEPGRSLRNRELPPNRVVVSFDPRLSRQALFGVVSDLWPQFREAGWVRPTRSLEARKLALVRFVCLESGVDTTWRERLRLWNERPATVEHGWTYDDETQQSARAFRSDFARAERSLTGQKYGLAWHYDSAMRRIIELDNRGELGGLVQAGTLAAEEYTAFRKWLGARSELSDEALLALIENRRGRANFFLQRERFWQLHPSLAPHEND